MTDLINSENLEQLDERNFTINFGPQHPAAHGVLRLVLELDGEIVDRVDPAYRPAAPRHREAAGTQDLSAGHRLFRPSRLCRADEPGTCLLHGRGKAWPAFRCPGAANISAFSYCEIGRILSHLLNVTTQAMDVGALTPPVWGFEEREKLMVFYERASGSRMHAAIISARVASTRTSRGDLLEDIGEWCDAIPASAGRTSTRC